MQGNLELTPEDLKQKGEDEICCTLKTSSELIHELGGIVTIHGGSKSNSIETITNSLSYKKAQKKEILDYIDIFDMGKIEDIEGYRDNVYPNIEKNPPMVICSDNHNINDYQLKCNCWIKADPNFEGLKQIICEPETRVKIQEEKPEDKIGYLKINKIRFNYNTSKNIFSNNYIELNSNLNSIIGGKSSGKSLLLYYIAKAINPQQISTLHKSCNLPEYNFEEDNNLDFEVEWLDGEINTLSQDESERQRQITYIPQMYIINLVDKKEGNGLNSKIEEIILENEDFKDFFNKQIQVLYTTTDKLFILYTQSPILRG
ncbi:MAG: hypothetical protein SVY15_09425 [Halobacteriota archaeon]|nr:hypothetical protein [Halobacteriota archaeon]